MKKKLLSLLRSIKKRIFPFSLMFLFWNGDIFAQPSINNVTGIVSAKSQLIIAGTGFGSKANAKPLYWADFDTVNRPTSLGQINYWLGVTGAASSPAGGVVTDTTPTGKGKVWRWDCQNSNTVSFSFRNTGNQSDRLFVSLKRYYDFDITDSANWGPAGFNLKVHRLWAGWYNRPTPWNNIYLGYQGMENPGGNPRVTVEYATPNKTLWPGASVAQIPRKWLNEEIIYRASDLNIQNGIFDYYRNGKVKWTQKFITRDTQKPDLFDGLSLDQVSNGTSSGPQYIYYDDIYVDDTWARVVIGDSAIWSKCTVREPQIPSAWTNTSITVTVNQGIFTDCDKAYLFVVDTNGNTSAGYPVTINCATTGTNEIVAESSSVSIYPNPFSESTTIDFSNLKKDRGNLSFHLYNLLGKEVAAYDNISDDILILEKNGLSQGMYLYHVMLNEQQINSGKLIVQ